MSLRYKGNVIYLSLGPLRRSCNANTAFKNPLSLGRKPSGTKLAEEHQLIKCRGFRTVFYSYIGIATREIGL